MCTGRNGLECTHRTTKLETARAFGILLGSRGDQGGTQYRRESESGDVNEREGERERVKVRRRRGKRGLKRMDDERVCWLGE